MLLGVVVKRTHCNPLRLSGSLTRSAARSASGGHRTGAATRPTFEANCPEFTTSAANPACGDFVRIGNGVPSTQLTAASWGSRAGGAGAALTRAPGNTGTLWAATGTGRVFISDNANDPAASVVWHRVDHNPVAVNDPGRFINGIYVDPANPHHAWISYNGYNFNTPAQPGHVFEVDGFRTNRRDGKLSTWLCWRLVEVPATGA